MSMDVGQEMSDDSEDYPKPQNKKKAKRSLTSKNFKFGSSKSLVSVAKQVVQQAKDKGLDKVDEDVSLSQDSSNDSLSNEGESCNLGQGTLQTNLLNKLDKMQFNDNEDGKSPGTSK